MEVDFEGIPNMHFMNPLPITWMKWWNLLQKVYLAFLKTLTKIISTI